MYRNKQNCLFFPRDLFTLDSSEVSKVFIYYYILITLPFIQYTMTRGSKTVLNKLNYNYSENCALLGYYVAISNNSLPTFRDNLSVPSSRILLAFLLIIEAISLV
jgi:hypothetical protein